MRPIFGHFHELKFNKQDLPNDITLGVIKVYDDLTNSSIYKKTQYMLLSGYCLYWCPVKWNGAFQTKTNIVMATA